MAVNISFQPSAGTVAGLGLLAGQSDYTNKLNQLGVQAWQTQQQIIASRLNAMQQAASEAQRQASSQQFQMQMMPQKAMLDAQQQAYHTQLGMGADREKQLLHAQIASQQSQQDFGEQQQLDAYRLQQQADKDAAHIAMQQRGDLENKQAMATFTEDQRAAMIFQSDPLQEYRQNMQQAQQAGYKHSDDQNEKMNEAKKVLASAQATLDKDGTLPSLLPAIKQSLATLRRISSNPEVAPQPSLEQQVSKDVLWVNQADESAPFSQTPKLGHVPMQKDQKTGQWQVIRGWKAPEPGEVGEDGQIVSEKTRGVQLQNQLKERKVNLDREDWVEKKLTAFATQNMKLSFDPTWPDLLEQERQKLYQTYDRAAHATPSGPLPVGPQQQPSQQSQVTPQNPQGEHTTGIMSPQNPAMQTQGQHPDQVDPRIQAQGIIYRLKNTPRNRWTPEDVRMGQEAYRILGLVPQQQSQLSVAG